MQIENLATLNDQQLVKKLKSLQTNKIIDATMVGFTIGIVVYGAINHGFGFFTFFPLVLTYAIVRNSTNNKLLEKEILRELESRNLKQ